MEITLRAYRPDDAIALLALFRDTIRRVNARDYAPQQIHAWAADDIDPRAWAAGFTGRFAIVAEDAGRSIGFADLERGGHIDRFFVSADDQRQGVGRAMLAALVREGRRLGVEALSAEVSITAKPFFESQQFETIARQTAFCRGIEFVNFRMSRTLADGS